MIRAAVLAALCGAAGAAGAAEVVLCEGFRASAENIPEPWEANSRSFANGAVRLALIDTVEPAAGAFHLMILSPPYDELGGRQCRLVGAGAGMGFAGLSFEGLSAAYDPARGLTWTLPVRHFDPVTAGFRDGVLSVTLNQATGQIVVR